jgi:hypothetical protein
MPTSPRDIISRRHQALATGPTVVLSRPLMPAPSRWTNLAVKTSPLQHRHEQLSGYRARGAGG